MSASRFWFSLASGMLVLTLSAAWADVGEEPVNPPAQIKKTPKTEPVKAMWAPVTIARGPADTLLVLPSRHTLVQLGFDVARIRSLLMIAYDDTPDAGDPVIHVWNDAAQDWSRMSPQQYLSGTLFDTPPSHVILVGPTASLPAGLADDPKWAAAVHRVPALDVVLMVNTLHQRFTFTTDEWKGLSRRYGFKLRDLNEERRRYGRYGKPGETRKSAVPMPETKTPPVQKESVPVPVSPAPQPDAPAPRPDTPTARPEDK